MKNPFIISGYAGPETFCDRVQETARLISLIKNGHNIVLSAPRRVGKTELIKHVFNQPEISRDFITVNTDIYATRSFNEFVACLGKGILDAIKPKGKKWIDNFIAVLTSLRSQFTFDINGMPVWSIGMGEISNPQLTLDEIFKYINGAEKPCLIAIDEFQQITKYPDAFKVEALLRTHIQHSTNAQFIYSGSHQHLMAEIFISAARPFYMSSTIMNLPLLNRDIYSDFCQTLFAENNRKISRGAVCKVYDRTSGITAYMQRIMNELYSATPEGEECGESDVDNAISTILDEANDSYQTLYYQLSDKQRYTMLAIATEGSVRNPMAGAFVKKYKLQSPSSVNSSIKTLLDKELLTKNKDGVMVYDLFFRLWLLRNF